MRNPFLLLLGISLMLSCNNQEYPTTITGKLTNVQDSIITIEISADHITRIRPTEYETEFPIEKDGTFSIPVTMTYPGTVTLISNDYQFIAGAFLLHGGEIHLTADCVNVKETLEYHGTNSGLNAFNFQWQKYYDSAYREIREQAKDFMHLKNGLDSLQDVSTIMLDEFSKTEILNKEELMWLKSKINYRKYSTLYRRAYLENARPGDSSYQFFETLNLEDHSAIQISPSYVSALLDYILHEANAKGIYYSKFEDNSEYFMTYYQIINENFDGKVHDVMLTILISNLLKNHEGLASELYERYLTDCNSADLIKKTSALYDDYLEVVNQNLSEKVVLIPTDQKSPMEVLSRFKNKVLVIDFWASWCSPCIQGIPHIKELAEHYKDSDVTVLFIGNSDRESNLINAIKKHQMDGTHIILNEEETEIWRREFNIQGIPTYVLIDKDGRQINLNNPHQLSEDSYFIIDSLISTSF